MSLRGSAARDRCPPQNPDQGKGACPPTHPPEVTFMIYHENRRETDAEKLKKKV